MGIRGQAPAAGVGQEGAEHRVIAEGADCQGGEQAEQTVRHAALDEVAGHAEEAEARALQQQAEQRAAGQRVAEGAAFVAAVGQLPDEGEQGDGDHAGRGDG